MLLQTKKICKQFGGVYALRDVSVDIRAGEVHGLVGENGAGKSTLIKILTGVYSLDSGEILWEGRPAVIRNPRESAALGIHVIHQDRQLVPAFSGVENCYLGLPYEVRHGRIDWGKMRSRVLTLASELGIEMNFTVPAARLTPPEQTMLNLMRALMNDCRLLILDEPTASLTDKETSVLFRIIGQLKEKGTSILYVTHRMEEIFRLTDRVTVMKNGQVAGTFATAEMDENKLIAKMTDNVVSKKAGSTAVRLGDEVLRVEHLSSRDGKAADVSLRARKGEILGVFGLGGSGRTEFLETLYGYRPMRGGTITVDGKRYEKPSPAASLKRRMVLICEDRRKMALIMPFSIRNNITLPVLSRYASRGILREKQEKQAAEAGIREMSVKCSGDSQPVSELSGGNQQKVVFAKAMQSDPEIFLCDEPTQAVDVMTRNEIHRLLRQRAEAGCAVVFVSSDLKEVLEVADEIQIIAHGKSGKLLTNDHLTSEEVLRCCYEEA